MIALRQAKRQRYAESAGSDRAAAGKASRGGP